MAKHKNDEYISDKDLDFSEETPIEEKEEEVVIPEIPKAIRSGVDVREGR